jgi:hypothetical protein
MELLYYQNLHEIVPNLWLGNMRAATCKKTLEQHQITHILTVANEIPPEYPQVSPIV